MSPRLVLAAAGLATAAAFAPAASATSASMGCPPGFYSRQSGLYSPLNGNPITYCYPTGPSGASVTSVAAVESGVIGCPLGLKRVPSGYYNPTTGEPIYICVFSPGP
jgi:hypothetical protein